MSVYSKKRADGTIAWYYNFMHEGKRYRGVGGTTKTQALRVQEKIRIEVINGQYLETRVQTTKFDDFVTDYLRRREHIRSKERDELSARAVLKFFTGKNLDEIRILDVEDYISKRRTDGVSNGTINRELACLKHMFNLAIKWGYAKKNPAREVRLLEEPPGRTRFLNKEEIKRLLDNCLPHFRPVVYTALNTGMRLGEILALTWDRVHLYEISGSFIEVTGTKNNKKRHIPLHTRMVELLSRLKEQNSTSEYVFLTSKGGPFRSIKTIWQHTLKRAEITDFRFHDLRHTFASYFIMNGGDILSLKEILGHSSLKMVERYTHLAAYPKRKQMENMMDLLT